MTTAIKKKPLTAEEQKKKDYELSMVHGKFYYHGKPGATLKIHARSEWGESIEKHIFKDQEEKTIPQWFKDYINSNGYIEVAHGYLLDADGNAIGSTGSKKKQIYNFV